MIQSQNMENITYEDFKKMDIRVGTIRHIEPVEGADKLLKFLIEFTEDTKTHEFIDESGTVIPVRQIVSGIKEFYPDYETLTGKQVLYIINLEPRTIRGVESHGMLMAVGEGKPIFLIPETPIDSGSKVR